MPPLLAATLCLIFTAVLLRWDARQRRDVSPATWIPTLYLLILGSRPLSQWINLSTPLELSGTLMEGSPADRLFFLILMACSIAVLIRRNVEWGQFITKNRLFVLFTLYCLVSVVWSDFAFIAFKRWIKALADPLIVLLLLTERNPTVAITTVLRRCAFILLPLSVVFIKYFPELGRTYSEWTGAAAYTGVTTNKNLLGYLLFVLGLFFVCTLAERKQIADPVLRRTETRIALLFLAMIGWLFNVADSKTALIAFAMAAFVSLAAGAASVRKRIGTVAILFIAAAWIVLTTDLGAGLVGVVGRDTTLTGRTDIWAAVLTMVVNPVFGAGFESFWLGERLFTLWDEFAFRPNQAHNGYLEIYLNAGAVGLILFVVFLVSSFATVRRTLMTTYASVKTSLLDQMVVARFGVGYVIAMLAYNVTEATFKPLNFLFIVLLLLVVDYRAAPATATDTAAVAARRRAWMGGRTQPAGRVPVRPLTESAWAIARRQPGNAGQG